MKRANSMFMGALAAFYGAAMASFVASNALEFLASLSIGVVGMSLFLDNLLEILEA